MSNQDVLDIGAKQVSYFRTPEFSKIMLENEDLMKKFAKASDDSRVVFITGSGTASMEEVVMNVFDENDKVLIVDGGSFGHRFVQLCNIHQVPYETIVPEEGGSVTTEQLAEYDGMGFTVFWLILMKSQRVFCTILMPSAISVIAIICFWLWIQSVHSFAMNSIWKN